MFGWPWSYKGQRTKLVSLRLVFHDIEHLLTWSKTIVMWFYKGKLMNLSTESWIVCKYTMYMTSFPDSWSQYMTSFPDPWSQYIPYQEFGNETQLYTPSQRCMEQFPRNPVKGRPTKAMSLCTQLHSYSNPVTLIFYQLASGTSHKRDTLLSICSSPLPAIIWSTNARVHKNEKLE